MIALPIILGMLSLGFSGFCVYMFIDSMLNNIKLKDYDRLAIKVMVVYGAFMAGVLALYSLLIIVRMFIYTISLI